MTGRKKLQVAAPSRGNQVKIERYLETRKTPKSEQSGRQSEQLGRKITTAQEELKEDMRNSEEVEVMKKKIREISEMKKTFPKFPPEVRSDVSEKISVFNSKANEVKCVIGSGYCVGHNKKLIRCVDMRRVS